jgi:hypothetical protein
LPMLNSTIYFLKSKKKYKRIRVSLYWCRAVQSGPGTGPLRPILHPCPSVSKKVYFVSDQPVLFWPTLVGERPEAHTTLATAPAPAPIFYFNIYIYFSFCKNYTTVSKFCKTIIQSWYP